MAHRRVRSFAVNRVELLPIHGIVRARTLGHFGTQTMEYNSEWDAINGAPSPCIPTMAF